MSSTRRWRFRAPPAEERPASSPEPPLALPPAPAAVPEPATSRRTAYEPYTPPPTTPVESWTTPATPVLVRPEGAEICRLRDDEARLRDHVAATRHRGGDHADLRRDPTR